MNYKIRGLFKFKGQDIRLNFLKWRKRRRQNASLRYFLQQPKKDARTALGKSLDTLWVLLLIWLAGFLLLAGLIGRPGAALALSAPLLAAGALLQKKLWAFRDQRQQLGQRLWLEGQKFIEEISKMETEEEFRLCVRDILGSLPGFQKISLRKGKIARDGGKELDTVLEGLFKGVPVAVRCVRQVGDKKVTPDQIRAFTGTLLLGNYKNGIFITTGDFGSGVSAALREAIRRGIKVKLAGRQRLIALARQSGAGAFQAESSVSGVPSRKAGEGRAATLDAFLDSAFGARKKAKSYFLFGVFLYGGHVLLKGSGIISLIYLLFAVLNLLMGACSLYFGRAPEDIDPLA